MAAPISFEIRTELSPSDYDDILRFLREYYLLPQRQVFSEIWLGSEAGVPTLTFSLADPRAQWRINASLRAGNPVQVHLNPIGAVPPEAIDRLREDLDVEVQRFEEIVRTSTLYFAWVKGQHIVAERPPSGSRRAAHRTFSGGLLLLQTLLLGLNIFLFVLLGLPAVFVILGLQLGLVLFADRLYLRTADWTITPEDREVHLVQYHIPPQAVQAFRTRFHKDLVAEIKREIYDRTFARGVELSRDVGVEVLSRYRVPIDRERLRVRVIDAYGIVQRAAEKFRMPTPKVVISNTMAANAAASGAGPKHGVMVLTTGLLVQLEEDEILSVVGHELGHLEGRDPLLMFGLTSAELLLRIFVFLPLVILSPLLYLLVALGAVYFIAKFFEARADLLSAMRIGQPQVLAEALRKIGFGRLREERLPRIRLMGWLRWDPHPPVSFRIDRLEAMSGPPRVNRPFAQSAKDVFRGFTSALLA